jgi:hypothetical protein
VESLKEFQGGAPATREVLFYGQEVGTSLGFVPSFKEHGLGTMFLIPILGLDRLPRDFGKLWID